MLPRVPTAQDRFKEVLTERVAPWLKQHGFKRRDTTFRREQAGAWQIINFQRSQSSDAREVPFTVNLGVALDVLHEEPSWGEAPMPLGTGATSANALGVLRTGEDTGEHPPTSPNRTTTQDVLDALEQQGLAWLDLHADPRSYLYHRPAP